MRLPKWVVKWVKDTFDSDKLMLKIRQQEAEIESLNKKIVNLKREALSDSEKEWATIVYLMMKWPLFWDWWDIFKEQYIKEKEDDEDRRGLIDSLPF